MKEVILEIFRELDEIIKEENRERNEEFLPTIKKAKFTILGQMSLLVQADFLEGIILDITGDLDMKIEGDYLIKKELKKLLAKKYLDYDEDSDLIFIPKNTKILKLFYFDSFEVFAIDPESALVSKAVKAPIKNFGLIVDALRSKKFPNLEERIKDDGGDIEYFQEKKNG